MSLVNKLQTTAMTIGATQAVAFHSTKTNILVFIPMALSDLELGFTS